MGTLTTKNFMVPFYGWGSTVSKLQSHYEETVYFLPLSSQNILVLIWSTLEGWKAEPTLEPTSGFEPGTPDTRDFPKLSKLLRQQQTAAPLCIPDL